MDGKGIRAAELVDPVPCRTVETLLRRLYTLCVLLQIAHSFLAVQLCARCHAGSSTSYPNPVPCEDRAVLILHYRCCILVHSHHARPVHLHPLHATPYIAQGGLASPSLWKWAVFWRNANNFGRYFLIVVILSLVSFRMNVDHVSRFNGLPLASLADAHVC